VRIYADTAALIAWFHPADEFAEAVTDWCRQRSPEFSWNPLLRMELRHNLRRLSGKYAAPAWHAYRASETSRKLRLEIHGPSELVDRGDELSARHAQESHAGTWDFVHVAAAQLVRAETFITCDAALAELARVSGLTQVHLFQ
jgi:predicted nucleic acid-binding protein